MGTVLDLRLRAYLGRGSPADERLLAERCAFEHEVRRFLTRAQERGYAYPMRFPQMPTVWVDFVNQNKAAETSIARLNVRRSYEAGRRGATETTNEGWASEPKAAFPARPDVFDPIAMIDRLVQDAAPVRRDWGRGHPEGPAVRDVKFGLTRPGCASCDAKPCWRPGHGMRTHDLARWKFCVLSHRSAK